MIKNLKKDFEQLEEAINQLEKETPTGARLALLLLDNLVEILMYRYINSEFAEDELYNQSSSLKYSASERINVRKYFDEKVKLINKLEVIDDDTAIILRKVHELRNEAYHLDILRENVLLTMLNCIIKRHVI